jgi:hypothetical protein
MSTNVSCYARLPADLSGEVLMPRPVPPDLFGDLADFEVDFFVNLVKSYAKLDIGMRGFFFHRIKQVVKEAIELLRAELDGTAEPTRGFH